MLYLGASSCTINNGYTSEYFPLTRSLRQGCPLSPQLYLLLAEILAQKIRDNEKIEGITINNNEKKIGQYADDTWAAIAAKQPVFDALLREIELFTLNCGLK